MELPQRLAARGADPADCRAARRTAGPLAAPARHHPPVPGAHVGRVVRQQRTGPDARRRGRARLGRVPGGRAAAPDRAVDVGQGGLPRRRGVRSRDARPLGGGRGAGAGADRARRGARGAGRTRLRGLAHRRARRRQRPRRHPRERRRHRLAHAAVLRARTARAAHPVGRARRRHPLGDRGPGRFHRRRRHAPGALRPHREGRRPGAVADGGAQRRGAVGGAHGGAADPRDRRPVDAALRPAAVPRGVVGADLRAAPRGGGGRAAAPDGQGAQPDPALHPRPRPRPADVAGAPGRPGSGGRGRADQRPHPAQHPALRLVAGGRRGQGRGGGSQPRAAGARRLPAEGADGAPGGAVPLRARVHPGRAAGVHGLSAAGLGHLGRGRCARGHGKRRRSARHHDRRDVYGHPPARRLGPVARAGGAAGVRADRGGRWSREW